MWRRGLTAIVACAGALAIPFHATQAQQPTEVDFGRDVQPILKANCVGCHGPAQQNGGFRVDRRRDAMRGGSLPVILPHSGETSRLILRLTGNSAGMQMPPTGPLSADQIATIKTWIDQGAEWPDALAGDVPPLPVDPIVNGMIDALRRGDRASFTRSFNSHKSAASSRGTGGTTPLMAATLYTDAATMKWLLDEGADPNQKNEAGATALMWAAPDLAKMRLLVDRGADVNAQSDHGRTAAMITAGHYGSIDALRFLLDHGAKVSVTGASLFGSTTSLLEAAAIGDEAMFELLRERGADLKSAGPFALALAYKSGCLKCADALLLAAPPPVVGIAASLVGPPLGDARFMAPLIEHGADPKMTDPSGRTLLMLAASSDALPIETVNALIGRGVDVNAKSPDGETALGFARLRGATPIVDLLVKAGAKDDAVTASKLTPSPAASPRAAIERAIPLLQKADITFSKKAGCVSCHNNTLTAMSIAAARAQGLRVDETTASSQLKTISAFADSWRERLIEGIGIPGDSETVSYILLGLAAERYPADATTDAMARFLKGKQLPDGRWEPLAHRPPLEASTLVVTAFAMRSLQLYAPAPLRAEYDAAVKRAASWLANQRPSSVNDDLVFRLLGLAWSKAARADVEKAAQDLIALQRTDGGWSQLASVGSDAYATGQAVYALRESGAAAAADPAVTRGVQFLLKTQLADGSWFVKTRAIPLQPFFESGFPHGRDQWISATATNWATLALARAK
jgi:ankyrin repeat protein